MAPRKLITTISVRAGIIIVIALAILLTPNLPIFDETLSPEITAQLAHSANPSIDGNGIYQLYGLEADSTKDTEAVGLAVVKALQSKRAKGESANLTEQEVISLYGPADASDNEWKSLYPAANCKPRENLHCFTELLQQLKENPVTHERLKTQLQRFERLIQQPHLIEVLSAMDFTATNPAYGTALQLSHLQQAIAYQQDGLDGLIRQSQKSMAFWRNALGENQTLLSRMVTLRALHADLLSISFAIANTPKLSPEQTQELQQLLRPLASAEITIDNALTGELRLVVENQSAYFKASPWYTRAMMQINASTNNYYRDTFSPSYRLGRMPAKDFYEHAETSTKPTKYSWLNPYNLGGKIGLSNTWQLADYIGRNHDLAGIYSLVALQLSIKDRPQEQWLDAIKASPHQNPYTRKPFDINTAQHSLSFPCFNPRDLCKILW